MRLPGRGNIPSEDARAFARTENQAGIAPREVDRPVLKTVEPAAEAQGSWTDMPCRVSTTLAP